MAERSCIAVKKIIYDSCTTAERIFLGVKRKAKRTARASKENIFILSNSLCWLIDGYTIFNFW